MPSEQPSAGRTSRSTDPATTHTVYRLRTFREKTVFEIGADGKPKKVLSTRLRQVGPSLYMNALPVEDPMPAEPKSHWPEIGDWKRKIRASKEYGLDGDLDAI